MSRVVERKSGVHCYACKVYMEDVDKGGIVYHANYLKYAERARTELLTAGGISHAQLMDAGFGAVVVSSLTIRYLRPLRLEETLEVLTKIENISSASAGLQQTMVRSGEVVADMDVRLACVSDAGRPVRWPEAVRQALLSVQA